jgi:hypothetical protein
VAESNKDEDTTNDHALRSNFKRAMTTARSTDSIFRGMICLSLAVGFEEDRARLGLAAAVHRLRNALIENALWLSGDDELLAGVLAEKVSSQDLAETLCSMRRMGLPGGAAH